MTPLLAGILGVALGIVVIVLIARRRRANDTVDSFRRGLDALSPEARRPVVDQVQHHTEPDEPGIGTDEGATDAPDDDEGSPRGT